VNETTQAMGAILPETSKKVIEARAKSEDSFRSSIQLPRKANKHLVIGAVNRVLFQGQEFEQATHGLVKSEREYVEDVVAEYTAWKSAKTEPSSEQSPVAVEPVLVGTKPEEA
jgi:hypothetical protein